MTLFHVNSLGGRLYDPAFPTLSIERLIANELALLPANAPIVIMIHGYKYAPHKPRRNPHKTLYASKDVSPNWKFKSWPNRMGMAGRSAKNGLAIGFAWNAHSDHIFVGPSLREVYARAGDEAVQLARLINIIHAIDPDRKVDLIAHSMGARVALGACHYVKAGSIGRVIMMGAAEFGAVALHAISSTAAKHAEFYNIIARHNDFYDLLFENFAPRPGPLDRSLGMNFPFERKNWVNIQIDNPACLAALAQKRVPISQPCKGFCHWSFYTHQGVFALYNKILDRQAGFTPHALAQILERPNATRCKKPLAALSFLSMRLIFGNRLMQG